MARGGKKAAAGLTALPLQVRSEFLRHYLSHKFTTPFAPMHLEWEKARPLRSVKHVARDHGKTSIEVYGDVLQRLCIWKHLRNHGHPVADEHVAIFGATEKLAVGRMRGIQTELERNRRILLDFGKFQPMPREGDWRQNEMVFAGVRDATDPTLFATGVLGSLPGYRLTDVILDDVVDPDRADDPAYQEDLVQWVKTVIEPMCVEGARIRLLETPWAPDDLGLRLQAEGWDFGRYPAIIDEEKGIVQWPERYPLRRLLQIRDGDAVRPGIGRDAFEAQYQCNPAATRKAGGYYQRTWFTVLPAIPDELEKAVRYWDLAATKADKGKDPDWTSGTLMARKGKTFPVLNRVRERNHWGVIKKLILDTARADRALLGNIPYTVAWEQEGGSGGAITSRELTELLVGFPVYADVKRVDKVERAKPASAQAEAGNIPVIAGPWVAGWLDSIVPFPRGAHDDDADSLSGAFAFLAGMTQKYRGLMEYYENIVKSQGAPAGAR